MAVAIRSITTDIGTQDPIQVTTPGDTEVGDLLLIITANDFYALSNIQTPTITGSPAVTEIVGARADAGTDGAHIKVWWAVANQAGALTITENESGSADEDKILAVYVLTGADTTTPVDAAAGTSGGSSTSHVAPSVSPSTSDAFLICHASSGGGAATSSHTPPSGMAERYDLTEGGISGAGATLQLSASGATGTKTFTAASSVPWGASTVAIRTASGGSEVTGTAAANLGALTAAATGVRTVVGAASASLGAASATAGGVRTVTGAGAAALGVLTAAASGDRTVLGTAASGLGALIATAAGDRTVTGAASAVLGALTATVAGKRTVVGTAGSNLGGLTATAVSSDASTAGFMTPAVVAAAAMTPASVGAPTMTRHAAAGPTMRGA